MYSQKANIKKIKIKISSSVCETHTPCTYIHTTYLSISFESRYGCYTFQDVEVLAKRLPNVAEKKVMPFPEFNHLDFLWANDIKTIVYDDLIEFMKRYERKYVNEVPHAPAEVDTNVVHSDYVVEPDAV